MLGRLLEKIGDIHIMNTLGKQVVVLLVLFAAGLAYFKSRQQPVDDAPIPREQEPMGGLHCLLLGQEAHAALVRVAAELSRGQPTADDRHRAEERVTLAVDAALHDCSVARTDDERQGVEEMRLALERIRALLPQALHGPPDAERQASLKGGLEEVERRLDAARPLLSPGT